MVTYKEFIEIDRNINERISFEYSDKVANILFKKMVKCNHCERYMSPYKSKSQHGYYYYYVGCTNKECPTKSDKKLKSSIRGRDLVGHAMNVMEHGINITKEIYEDALSKYSETKKSQSEILEQPISTLRKDIKSLESNIDGLAMSLGISKGRSRETLSENINNKSEELAEKKSELKRLEEGFIKLESKISDEAMTYEKFSNFFKKAGTAIRSSDNLYLLDQLLRNVFLNFFIEDGKVAGHMLKEPFATYEIMGSDVWGRLWKEIRTGLMAHYLNLAE